MKKNGWWSPAGLVLFLTWLFFGMYYMNRFNFSPMIPLLKADLNISNAQAGWLMALFFITYTIFQLPAGYWADRFGPRKIIAGGALISIIGNLIFSQGSTFLVLSIGQCVNGFGQAMGWTSALKLIVSWFPRSKRATAIGLFATCVTGGSSAGIRLAGYLGHHFGWQSAFIVPPVLMGAALLVFWIFVRDHPAEKGLAGFKDEIELEQRIDNDPRPRLMVVLSNRVLWIIALIYFCFVYVQFGCLVWIPAFLQESYAMTVDRASTIAALVLLPGVFASPLAGFSSDHYFGGRRKPLLLSGMALLAGSTFCLALGVNIILAACLLAVVGLMIIMPDILLATFPSDILSRKLAATGMGFLTTFTSMAGIITTPLSGKIVDIFQSYGAVFLSFAIAALTGTILTLFIREKKIHPNT
ncbi:MAG: MFS transporter [Desulfobacterales bacterium]|nr:MFS transporter [Desulfobacterales bacterium]